MDVKEIMEALEGMKLMGVFGKKVSADKMVNLADLPYLMELAGHSSELYAAVDGIKLIPAEVKDLSAEEANQVLAKIFEVLAAIKAA